MNHKKPLVSVIVPVYNVEPYLEKCIESIITQTYPNIEIILVDDGSTDGSPEICDGFSLKDNRIKVIHQMNLGLSAARNRGLDESNGYYYGFIDSDDWIDPNMIEALVIAAEECDADIACCGWLFHKSGSVVVSYEFEKHCLTEKNEMMKELLKNTIGQGVWNKIWKASLFADGECRFPNGRVYEDSAVTWRLINRCEKMVISSGVYYHYRFRDNSIVNTPSLNNICDLWFVMKERHDNFSDEYDEECQLLCLRSVLIAAAYAWKWAYGINRNQRAAKKDVFADISSFARKYSGVRKTYPIILRTDLFLASYNCEISLFCCYRLNQLSTFIKHIILRRV